MIEVIREVLSWALLVGGSVLVVTTGIALLRLPDYYSRVHGASLSDTLGAGLILLGLATQAGWSLVSAKLMLILLFMVMTGPAAAHALAKAAYLHNVIPQLGKTPPPGTAPDNGSAETEPTGVEPSPT